MSESDRQKKLDPIGLLRDIIHNRVLVFALMAVGAIVVYVLIMLLCTRVFGIKPHTPPAVEVTAWGFIYSAAALLWLGAALIFKDKKREIVWLAGAALLTVMLLVGVIICIINRAV